MSTCEHCVNWGPWTADRAPKMCVLLGVKMTPGSSCSQWTCSIYQALNAIKAIRMTHEHFDLIHKVFEHGATKHPDIAPTHEHLAHAIEHLAKYRMDTDWVEKESGLPHHAHVTARLVLALYRHINDVEGRNVNATVNTGNEEVP